MPSEPIRAWLYRIFVAVVPLLTFYGIVDDRSAPLWVAFAASILGFGLASANTSTRDDL